MWKKMTGVQKRQLKLTKKGTTRADRFRVGAIGVKLRDRNKKKEEKSKKKNRKKKYGITIEDNEISESGMGKDLREI